MPNCNPGEEASILELLSTTIMLCSMVQPQLSGVMSTCMDVVVILMRKLYDLKAVKDNVDIWIAFCVGRRFRVLFISIFRIYLPC